MNRTSTTIVSSLTCLLAISVCLASGSALSDTHNSARQLRDEHAQAATVEFRVRHKRGPRERYGFAEKRSRKRYV